MSYSVSTAYPTHCKIMAGPHPIRTTSPASLGLFLHQETNMCLKVPLSHPAWPASSFFFLKRGGVQFAHSLLLTTQMTETGSAATGPWCCLPMGL